jgi:hypothetical protein
MGLVLHGCRGIKVVILFKLSPLSFATVVLVSIPFSIPPSFDLQPQHIYRETVDAILNLIVNSVTKYIPIDRIYKMAYDNNST